MYDLYYAEDKLQEVIVDEISYAVWNTIFKLTEYEAGFVALEENAYHFNNYGFFDGETGEIIEYTALLKDGWQEHVTVVNSEELLYSVPKHTSEEKAYIERNEIPPNAEFYSLGTRNGSHGVPVDGKGVLTLEFYCPDSQMNITVYIDSDYVKTHID